MKVKPLKIIPLHAKPLVPMKHIGTMQEFKFEKSLKPEGMNFGGGQSIILGGGQAGQTLPDAGNQPDPTRAQIEHFRKNRDKIVGSVVKTSLRKHPQDVLHGSRSLQMLIPNYPRQPGDWDMYSPQEKKRALALEAAIDRKVGADIVETRYCPIPKVTSGPDDPGTSKDLYRIVSPDISNDADIDIMDKPKQLKIMRQKGITHERLDEAYVKARRRIRLQPIKAGKAVEDSRSIADYFKKRGLKLPEEKQSHPMMWERI